MGMRSAALRDLRTAVVVLLLSALLPAAHAAGKEAGKTLDFAGTAYVHRWSKGGQNEFTPTAQTDLERWSDMVTLNVHSTVTDGDGLAGVANSVLGSYGQYGKILRTDSKPRTEAQEAEHFAAALLPGKGFMEASFVRFLLVDGIGVVAVRSHREYGADAATKMGAWVQSNGPVIEEQLMGWDGIPKVADLQRLPTTK